MHFGTRTSTVVVVAGGHVHAVKQSIGTRKDLALGVREAQPGELGRGLDEPIQRGADIGGFGGPRDLLQGRQHGHLVEVLRVRRGSGRALSRR